jgi:putative DNA primase/helicase
MAQKFARNTTEVAALRGARFVVAMETPENRRINETLVKALTGGDRIRARFLYHDSFEFAPELKLFIGTNHRPTIKDDSGGMWRRIRLVPFDATFDGTQRDVHLQATLAAEETGILAWAVEGAKRVYDGEPGLPERVRIATEGYQAEQDTLAQFIDEECELYEFAQVEKSVLYHAYMTWCNGRGEPRKAFTARLRRRGFDESRVHGGGESWCGIALSRKDLN